MTELIFSFLLLISFVFISGLIFSNIFFKDNIDTINFGEFGLLGIVILTYLAFLIHFFFPLNTKINLITILFFIFYFAFNYKIYLKKNQFENKIIFISILIVIIMTVKYRPNEDYGFYHLPYIINIISEKVIFGLSNIQPQYAWNSSWLNFSAILNVPYIGIKGTQLSNSLLYLFIIIFFFIEITKNKNIYSLSKFYILFLCFYTLIKFSRISEHGFDFPVNFFLLISIFYFIKMLETKKKDQIEKNFKLLIILITLSLTIKLTSFIGPFIVFYSIYHLYEERIKIKKILPVSAFCLSFLFFWFIQQFIYSGCFVPFFEFTCIKSVSWSDTEISKVLSGATGAINKSYYQYKGILSETEYGQNFNWVSTWFLRHKVEFLEHFAAFIIPILFFLFLNMSFLNKKNKKIKFINEKKKIILILFVLITFGLIVWFIRSPVIRFGIPYLFCFTFLLVFLLIKKQINVYNNKSIITIICLCVIFNVTKNITRINEAKSLSNIFPTILENNYSTIIKNGFEINYPDPKIVSSQSQFCWSIPFICDLGKARNREYKKINGYLFVIRE